VTAASQRPRLTFSSLDEVASLLRRDGGRLSAARRAILEALFAADGPVSAEFLAAGLGGRVKSSDLASVYRNLERLEELGVVQHVHLGHGPGLYALAHSGEREYLVCERCHRVTTVGAPDLDGVRRSIRRRFGYRARFSHFPIMGLCALCAEAIERADVELESEASSPGGRMPEEHPHEQPHDHQHTHGDETHAHPHSSHEHGHTEHEHEHSHGDRVHSHPHVHEEGLEEDHDHEHEGS
jgi:Fur family transcriptional regulator, ferric uptake regulator